MRTIANETVGRLLTVKETIEHFDSEGICLDMDKIIPEQLDEVADYIMKEIYDNFSIEEDKTMHRDEGNIYFDKELNDDQYKDLCEFLGFSYNEDNSNQNVWEDEYDDSYEDDWYENDVDETDEEF